LVFSGARRRSFILSSLDLFERHCERSEATQVSRLFPWVASPATRNDGVGSCSYR
jgi:hypothetical protein